MSEKHGTVIKGFADTGSSDECQKQKFSTDEHRQQQEGEFGRVRAWLAEAAMSSGVGPLSAGRAVMQRCVLWMCWRTMAEGGNCK